ncbi:HAD family hydrolase [Nocardiopsis mangrovi]|uniref:HAD family hydrolase n=1 Tax=Nocardiopsis mangrovi TaxID=1179818 RepID=A0ABV9DUN2_9ACTN
MAGTCRGIITDWGGVLTPPLPGIITEWLAVEGLDVDHYRSVMQAWIGSEYGGTATAAENPVHALERGEIGTADFERLLAGLLRRVDGGAVVAEGLIDRMFAGFLPIDEMYEMLRLARGQGVRTCLLSNSWGNSYPRELFTAAFDTVVISGEVGMRKPDPAIFRHACDGAGLAPEECVFIDDIEHNVQAAVDLGMTGILHRDAVETRERLAETCGVELHALPS